MFKSIEYFILILLHYHVLSSLDALHSVAEDLRDVGQLALDPPEVLHPGGYRGHLTEMRSLMNGKSGISTFKLRFFPHPHLDPR